MLEKITAKLYLGITIVYILIILKTLFISNETINNNSMYIFFLIFLPVLDILIEYVKNNSKNLINKKSILEKIVTGVILTLIANILFPINNEANILLIYAIYSLLFLLDEGITFSISLFFLLLMVASTILGKAELANLFSITIYYLLILGIINTIANALNSNKRTKIEKEQNKKPSSLSKKTFYITVSIYIVLFILMLRINPAAIQYITYIMLGIYVIFKLTGNHIEYKKELLY